MSKGRFEAFSDGVFAVAITLLVLEIHLPTLHDVTNAQLGLALWPLWPQVLTYVISFATIGIIWLNHHAMFHLVEQIDRNTLIFNLLLLMIVCFIPFSTSVLTTYGILRDGVFLYGGTLTALALAYNLLWYHAARHVDSRTCDRRTVVLNTVRNLSGSIVYLGATLCAFLDPRISVGLFLAVALFYLLPGKIDAVVDARGNRSTPASSGALE